MDGENREKVGIEKPEADRGGGGRRGQKSSCCEREREGERSGVSRKKKKRKNLVSSFSYLRLPDSSESWSSPDSFRHLDSSPVDSVSLWSGAAS